MGTLPAEFQATADPMRPDLAVIRRTRRETHDIRSLEIERPAGARFVPGQFNMLYLFGRGEVAISMSGDARRAEVITHTIRAVGPVTRGLCGLKRGDTIGVRGPFGSGWPMGSAHGCDVVVVAGGVGLAPLRPAVYHLLSNRHEYGKISLLYGTRTPLDLLFARELENWRGRFDVQVGVTVDAPAAGWRGNVGVVTTLIPQAQFDPARTVAFICGPEVMMRFTVRTLMARGVPADRLYVSMERNMKCAVGFCGHCQLGPTFVCKDGPVFRYDRIEPWFSVREL